MAKGVIGGCIFYVPTVNLILFLQKRPLLPAFEYCRTGALSIGIDPFLLTFYMLPCLVFAIIAVVFDFKTYRFVYNKTSPGPLANDQQRIKGYEKNWLYH